MLWVTRPMKINIKHFLFKNMGIRQTVFKNAFWLTVAEAIVQILKLALIVYMAKILGAEEYGKFSFALSFVCLLVIFAELGLPDIITREFSLKEETREEYPAVISLKIFLSIFIFLVMLASSFFITQDLMIRKSIWLLGLFILITSFVNIIYAFFRAQQKMEYESVAKIIQYLLLAGFSFLVLFTVPSIISLSYVYLFTNLAFLVAILFFFHFFIRPVSIKYNSRVFKKFMHSSWPLTLGMATGWIYVSISSVMLGYFGYHMENGWYNAAYKIIGAVAISAILISRSFFPVLSKFSAQSKEKMQNVWNYQKQAMMVVALGIVPGAIALAPKIIYFFYDASFAPSIFAFRWLAVVCALDFLYFCYASVLVVFNREKRNFIFICVGLAVNVVLNFMFIPSYGLRGVVVANVASSLLVLLLAMVAVMRHTPISPFNAAVGKTFLAGIISGLAMFFLISMPGIYSLNLVVVVLIGIAAYFLALFLCFKTLNLFLWKKV